MIPITFDYAFKSIFSKNKDILKKFLISVLELDLKEEECNINLGNVEMIKENKKEYSKTIDLNVVLNDNLYVDIEVNRSSFNSVKLRNFLFANKFFSMVLDKGEKAESLKDKYVYQLNLNAKEREIDFGEDYVVAYGMKSKQIYTDHLQIIVKYLEFYRKLYYNKDVKLKESEIWLATLTARNFSELKEMLLKVITEEGTDRIVGDMIKMSEDGFVLHEWKKDIMDDLVKLEEERIHKEEKEEAVALGKAEARKNEKIEIAKNMVSKGMDNELIAEITSLSIEEIESLK